MRCSTEERDEGDAGVLDAGVVGAPLPALVGSEHDALAAHTDRHAALDDDLREPDPRDVAGCHQPRQQVEPAVGVAPARRVEDAELLEGVRRVRAHDHARAAQGVGDVLSDDRLLGRHPFTPEPRSEEVKWRWNATKRATAGAASTQAPARMAPYGFVARPATLDR